MVKVAAGISRRTHADHLRGALTAFAFSVGPEPATSSIPHAGIYDVSYATGSGRLADVGERGAVGLASAGRRSLPRWPRSDGADLALMTSTWPRSCRDDASSPVGIFVTASSVSHIGPDSPGR